MKPLHSQRIKQGQRILLISGNQKEGVRVGVGLLGAFCATFATREIEGV